VGHRANFVVVDRGGWELYYSHWEFWNDGYERQLEAAGHTVVVPACDGALAFDRFVEALFHEKTRAPGLAALEYAEGERAAGKVVVINPAVWAHTETQPDPTRTERLKAALARVEVGLRG
jgi:hypothetical protein